MLLTCDQSFDSLIVYAGPLSYVAASATLSKVSTLDHLQCYPDKVFAGAGAAG